MKATLLAVFVSLGLLVGCESAAKTAPPVDRAPSGFSSLLPPPGKVKWPERIEVSRRARLAAETDPDLVQFAIDSLVVYFDRPNPAALNYTEAVSYAAAGRKVVLDEKAVSTTAARRDATIHLRFAPPTVRGSLQSLQSNDDSLRRHQWGYLGLGGGLSRVMVTHVVKGADEDVVSLYADVWSADVGIDPNGVLGAPTIRGSTWHYDVFLTSHGDRLLVKDFEPQMADPSAYNAALGAISGGSPNVVVVPGWHCKARWHRVAPVRLTACRSRF